MQIGSGTFDGSIAITYLGQSNTFSWGNQLRSLLRFGENEREFRYGNKYSVNNWFFAKASNWLSFSIRAEGLIIDEIDGIDPNLNSLMVITTDTNNSGDTYINGGLGINVYVPYSGLKNLRFGIELAAPLYQDLKAIQLKMKETIILGTQYSF